MQQQINAVWFMFYIKINFKFIFSFFTYHWLTAHTFFNVSFSFGHDDVNQLRCSVGLIWLKKAYFQN